MTKPACHILFDFFVILLYNIYTRKGIIEMKMKYKILYISILTVLFVLFNLIAKSDEYVIYAFSILTFGYTGICVGVIGSALGALFSIGTFNFSLVFVNLFIGLIFAFFSKREDEFGKMVAATIACLIGVAVGQGSFNLLFRRLSFFNNFKNNFLRSVIDSLMMWIGIVFWKFNPFSTCKSYY